MCLGLNVGHLLDLAVWLDLNLCTDLGLALGLELRLRLRLCRSHRRNNGGDRGCLHMERHGRGCDLRHLLH